MQEYQEIGCPCYVTGKMTEQRKPAKVSGIFKNLNNCSPMGQRP
jgi:hypothetical protein